MAGIFNKLLNMVGLEDAEPAPEEIVREEESFYGADEEEYSEDPRYARRRGGAKVVGAAQRRQNAYDRIPAQIQRRYAGYH